MTTDEVVRRLRAFERGKPLPSGEKLGAVSIPGEPVRRRAAPPPASTT